MTGQAQDRRLGDRRMTMHEEHEGCSDCEDSWLKYQLLVMNKLEEMGREIRDLRSELQQVLIDQATHKGKMIVIGSVVAFITTWIAQHLLRGR